MHRPIIPSSNVIAIATAIALLFIGIIVGYIAGNLTQTQDDNTGILLRSNGYELVSPVLFSDYGDDQTSSELIKSQADLGELIGNYKSTDQIDQISIYYRDLFSGQQIVINNQDRYFPASLTKLPLAMAYYYLSESNPSILTTRGQIDFQMDYNAGLEIAPEEFPISGQSYSVQQLIDMMLKHSDNGSFSLLISRPEAQDTLKKLFNDIRINYPFDQSEIKDVFTVKEVARFYRLLHNATYLSPEHSEELLKTLTASSYSKGVVAGVPSNTKVAHKFGLETQRDLTGNLTGRQLHDCGIVYTAKPYIICIMTKSGDGDLVTVEGVISNISKTIYQQHINNLK